MGSIKSVPIRRRAGEALIKQEERRVRRRSVSGGYRARKEQAPELGGGPLPGPRIRGSSTPITCLPLNYCGF
jgi:hypothetical protein